MPRLTPIHWKKFEKFLLSVGCEFVKKYGSSSGTSHRKYSKPGLKRPVVITVHGRGEIPIFHIKTNLNTLGISTKKYLELLSKL